MRRAVRTHDPIGPKGSVYACDVVLPAGFGTFRTACRHPMPVQAPGDTPEIVLG